MTSITLYGAVNEIGGNKVLIEDRGTRVFFDFGLSFGKYGDFFSPFVPPRKWNLLEDYIKLGLLPDLDGLYRQDYEKRLGKPATDPLFDAIVLSHPHLDHAGLLSLVRPDIPIYCSNGCKAILQAIQETGYGFNEFLFIKELFQLRPGKRDKTKLLRDRETYVPREFKQLKPVVSLDDIVIHSFPVDHSVPGACSFVIETSEGTSVYTGDIRFHGRKANFSSFFVRKAAEFDPSIMLSEGTRVAEPTSFGELDLQRDLYGEVAQIKGLVTANFPVRDFDRMRSFIEVANQTDRSLVVSLKQAYTLDVLNKHKVIDVPKFDEIKVFIPRKGWGIFGDSSYPEHVQMQDYQTWERGFISENNSITIHDIADSPQEYIFRVDPSDLKFLLSIEMPEDSIYIKSVTEPVDEEMELDQKRIDNWLHYLNLYPYTKLHCSGHASGGDLKNMVNTIDPETIIPIHTEHPEAFGLFNAQIQELELGESYLL